VKRAAGHHNDYSWSDDLTARIHQVTVGGEKNPLKNFNSPQSLELSNPIQTTALKPPELVETDQCVCRNAPLNQSSVGMTCRIDGR